jgi:hypothetical protein
MRTLYLNQIGPLDSEFETRVNFQRDIIDPEELQFVENTFSEGQIISGSRT